MKYYKEKGIPIEKIALFLRKGVFPYEYINSHERFKETKLPPIEEFNTVLKGKCTQEKYEHAQIIWKEFKCKNLGEFNDIYLRTDVLLLADVWNEFREMSMKHYKLDPSHYISAASFSWDAMLKHTGIKMELFTDMSMHNYAEQAKRGGITMASRRHFHANNPKCNNFNPKKPKSWLMYVDANNLYGWAMSQYLPTGNYKWEYSEEFLNDSDNNQKVQNTILKKRPDASRGCLLKMNSYFPSKTHDYLNDLPPAVESLAVKQDRFSPKQGEYLKDMNKKRYTSTEKLVPHLGPRKEYVLHYLEFQYYVKLGMVVEKITEVLSFDQSPWLAPYISLNSKLRQRAKNSFERDFFKLMNNSVYGKTMENVRKYMDVKLLPLRDEKDEQRLLKKISKPSYKYSRLLGKDLVGVNMGKSEVVLNKPIIIGACVLGLSKLHIVA